MQILLRLWAKNDGTSFWLLKKAQLVEGGNLILLHPRFKSYDLDQKGLYFVTRSQITLLLSLDSLKFHLENIILFCNLGLHSPCPVRDSKASLHSGTF